VKPEANDDGDWKLSKGEMEEKKLKSGGLFIGKLESNRSGHYVSRWALSVSLSLYIYIYTVTFCHASYLNRLRVTEV